MSSELLTETQKKADPEPPPRAAVTSPGRNRLLGELGRTVLGVAIVAAGVLGMFSFGTNKPPERKADDSGNAALVQAVEIISHEGSLDVTVDGLTVPFREILIAAEVAGRVDFKSDECRAGNFVKQGTSLLRIDRSDYELEVTRLEQRKKEARQNLDELAVEITNTDALIELATGDLKLRDQEVDRQRRLSASGVGTTTDYENALRAQLQSANAKKGHENQRRLLVTRKARLETSAELAEIQLQQARLDLERTEITAPVDGVIVNEMVEADSYVQLGAQLLTIEDTEQVEVRCSLTMDELYRLWQSAGRGTNEYDVPDTPVTVTYELADRVFAWQGTLSRYDGLDSMSGRERYHAVLLSQSRATYRNSTTAARWSGFRTVRRRWFEACLCRSESTQLLGLRLCGCRKLRFAPAGPSGWCGTTSWQFRTR